MVGPTDRRGSPLIFYSSYATAVIPSDRETNHDRDLGLLLTGTRRYFFSHCRPNEILQMTVNLQLLTSPRERITWADKGSWAILRDSPYLHLRLISVTSDYFQAHPRGRCWESYPFRPLFGSLRLSNSSLANDPCTKHEWPKVVAIQLSRTTI